MIDSRQPGQKINFIEQYPELFQVSSTEVSRVNIPKLHYLSSIGT